MVPVAVRIRKVEANIFGTLLEKAGRDSKALLQLDLRRIDETRLLQHMHGKQCGISGSFFLIL
jgi:hypothetical protein